MKVSLISVTFNSSKTLQETIDSISFQDYVDIEYIIVDGASSDGSLEIIKKNEIVVSKWISEPDNGLYDAMNKGIKMATGDIVGIINSDDFYHRSNAISKVVETFQESKADCVFADIIFVDPLETNRVIRYYTSSGFRPWKMKFGFMPAHPTFFTYRKNFDSIGFYNPDYKIAADFELILRFLVKSKMSYKYLPLDLLKMRVGGVSTASIKSTIQINKENLDAFRKNGLYSNYLFLFSRYLIKIFHFLPIRNRRLMRKDL